MYWLHWVHHVFIEQLSTAGMDFLPLQNAYTRCKRNEVKMDRSSKVKNVLSDYVIGHCRPLRYLMIPYLFVSILHYCPEN